MIVAESESSKRDSCAASLTLDNSIELCKMKIYFNNINGFLNKRAKFLNNVIAKDFDVILLQETNIKKTHKFYDDFSYVKKLATNLHYCDSDYFSRGSLLAWNPETVSAEILKKQTAAGFEIGIAELSSKLDKVTIVSAYRSPSMNIDRTEEYFDALHDTLVELTGKIILVGDLNVQKGRKIHHKSDEEFYLKQIESVGLKSYANGVTHPSHNNQLYCFSNLEPDHFNCAIIDGFASDHCAFQMSVDIRLEKIYVPGVTVLKWDSIDQKAISEIIEINVNKIIKSNAPIGIAILEFEIFIWELQEHLVTKRFIKPHIKIRNCSRQNSVTLLNSSIDNKEKRRRISQNLKKDASRSLKKSLQKGSIGSRLMASYNLGAKGEQILRCNLNPDDFKNDILADELRVDHTAHDSEKYRGRWRNLLRRFDLNKTEAVMSKLKLKWHVKQTFCEKFWRFIAMKIGSADDYGVYTFSFVETVLKKPNLTNQTKGWRMVWKASSQFEKMYDLLKALSMDVSQFNNDAYCADRSTQKALTKVCSWNVPKDHVVLGCDYQNAFGMVCRPCINTLLDTEFIDPEMHFQVATSAGVSEPEVSRTGSGAGKAKGGPGFNLIFNHHLDTNISLAKMGSKIAPYADDSQVLVERCREKIKVIIEAFMEGEKYGLFMHKIGDKGPTILTRPNDINDLDLYLNEKPIVEGVHINVVDHVKFLGVEIKICADFSCVVASLTTDAIRTLSFFVTELNRNVKMLSNSTNKIYLNQQFYAFSFAVSSTIESRIQYAIAFLCAEDLYTVIDIHKRTICALTGKSFRFFGFKKLKKMRVGFVSDLFEFLSSNITKTYKKLCLTLGRPNILQIAFRALSVVIEQSNFDEILAGVNFGSRLRQKIPFIDKVNKFLADCRVNGIDNSPPRSNEFYKTFIELDTSLRRKNFLKIITDNMFLDHLKAKGWYKKNMSCRIEGCEHDVENISHAISDHIDMAMIEPGVKRDLGRMMRIEVGAGEKRKILLPLCKTALVLTNVYGDVKDPYLKLSKKNKDSDNPPKRKKRRLI